jgi:hypothetical protein
MDPPPTERRVPLPAVFWTAVGVLAVLFQPNLFLNDEVPQTAGLDALAHGHLWVGKPPAGYDPFLSGIYHYEGIPTQEGFRSPPVGSTLLNVLALPVLGVLHGLSAAVGVRWAMGLALGGLAALAAWHGLGLLSRPPPRTGRAAWSTMAFAAFIPLLAAPPLPAEPYLEIAALHLVGMAATALAATFLFDLFRGFLPETPALVAAATFLVATPALFWGLNAKYHALAMSLAALALWCYRDGARTPPLRTLAAFAVAGLAWWNKPALGAVLLASLGLVALPALRLGWRGAASRAMAGAAGLAFAAAPEFLFRRLTAAINWGPPPQGTIQPGPLVLNPVAAVQATSASTPSASLFLDPAGAANGIWQTLVWTRWQDVGVALSFLCAAPFVVVGAAALVRRFLRRGLPMASVAMAALYGAILLAAAGHYLLAIGAGYDMRHAATLWPFAVLLCAPGVGGLLQRRGTAWAMQWAGVAAILAVALAVVLNLLAHHAGFALTPQHAYFDQTLVARWAGLAVGLALLVALVRFPGSLGQDLLLAASLGLAASLQVLVKLAIVTPEGEAPFAAWPTALLSQVLRWLLFSH